jgi:RimJ/RimL family protein N-acetyltransferase
MGGVSHCYLQSLDLGSISTMARESRDDVVRGPRLALARFHEDDVDAVQAFASDPEVCRFTTWGPNTLDETRSFIANAHGRGDDSLELAVMRGGDLIGSAAVWTANQESRREHRQRHERTFRGRR